VERISPKGLKTSFTYDEMNRLVKKIDSLGAITQFGYDGAGNRVKMVDPKETVWAYEYYPNNLLKKAQLTGADKSTYFAEYTFSLGLS
jgi:YD repeat-containing protein